MSKYKEYSKDNNTIDFTIIGCGIISATLAVYLKELFPKFKVHIYERLPEVSKESSCGWNNSGTGHAAFCEMNYTNRVCDGSIDIRRALKINLSFNLSLQFWAYLVKQDILKNPEDFIRNVPHISFVSGKKNVEFLYDRFQALRKNLMFSSMQYSEDYNSISKWIPLVINGRNLSDRIAATYMSSGTDVNFGEITRQLIYSLKYLKNFKLYLNHDVVNLKKNLDNTWNLYIKNKNELNDYNIKVIKTKKLFIGCGGGSLRLIQKSKIIDMYKYAGFPISSKFLITNNVNLINRHNAKVYGMAKFGSPPMSVPHIDKRFLDGKEVLFFGPFAGFNTKFLKYGSWKDFFKSINIYNILPIINTGIKNLNLVKYLICQCIMTNQGRINSLREYYPKANINDWKLIEGGQRVQVIKKSSITNSQLHFGTELVLSSDNSLSALLGASPGASVSSSIILKLIKKIFYKDFQKFEIKNKVKKINPFYNLNLDLENDVNWINEVMFNTAKVLKLKFIEIKS